MIAVKTQITLLISFISKDMLCVADGPYTRKRMCVVLNHCQNLCWMGARHLARALYIFTLLESKKKYLYKYIWYNVFLQVHKNIPNKYIYIKYICDLFVIFWAGGAQRMQFVRTRSRSPTILWHTFVCALLSARA